MNKICTDLEQSKHLQSLGIDVNTADMYWWSTSLRYYVEAMDDGDFNEDRDIPAWSLSALLELIPPYLGEFSEGIDFGFGKAMNWKWYSAHYIKLDNSGLATFSKVTTGETSVDAAFEMVCWLKENNEI